MNLKYKPALGEGKVRVLLLPIAGITFTLPPLSAAVKVLSSSPKTTGATTRPLLPKVIFSVIAPVLEFFVIPIKPFSALTGPLKVVFALFILLK